MDLEPMREMCELFGEMALVFIKGIGEKVVVAGTFIDRGAEATKLFFMLGDEEKQFAELSRRSFERHQKQLELDKVLGNLENDRVVVLEQMQRTSIGLGK